jgi:hypothetical protein
MVDTAWTFTVVFIAIFSVLIAFAFLWLMQVRAAARDERQSAARSPDAGSEAVGRPVRSSADRRDRRGGGSHARGAGRPAGLAHR